VGSRDGLDVVEKGNISCFFQDSSPGPSSGGLRIVRLSIGSVISGSLRTLPQKT